MPGKWEKRDIAHTAEVCKALVRIPVIKYAQIAQLVGIRRTQSFRLVRHAYDSLVPNEYVPGQQSSSRYNGANGLQYYVRLTRDAAREWGGREGIQPRNLVRSRDVVRYIATMDVLVGLHRARLLYEEWDMTLPTKESMPFHAELRHIQSGYRLGVFLLPHKYVGNKARKKLSVIHGIVRKVDQKATVSGVLYLIPREHYADALRMMLKLQLNNATSYLLPLESFLEKPRYYLWALRLGERWYLDQLEQAFQPEAKLRMPVHYGNQYEVLWKLDDRIYRFVDSYVAGDIGRIKAWLFPWSSYPYGYQIPDTGSIAAETVYVFDNTVQEALATMAENRTESNTEFHPWPIDDEDDDYED